MAGPPRTGPNFRDRRPIDHGFSKRKFFQGGMNFPSLSPQLPIGSSGPFDMTGGVPQYTPGRLAGTIYWEPAPIFANSTHDIDYRLILQPFKDQRAPTWVLLKRDTVVAGPGGGGNRVLQFDIPFPLGSAGVQIVCSRTNGGLGSSDDYLFGVVWAVTAAPTVLYSQSATGREPPASPPYPAFGGRRCRCGS